jgi:hypothetical protein
MRLEEAFCVECINKDSGIMKKLEGLSQRRIWEKIGIFVFYAKTKSNGLI